jgi:SAM-dependent methyltransferase
MAQRICPWWLGYFLACPLRRLYQDPRRILAPFVREGMTLLEPGPGMGFFTLEMAKMVGPKGRVVCTDIQPRMLERLRRRAVKAAVSDRIDARLIKPETMGLEDLKAQADFCLAFAVAHEMPDAVGFFKETHAALKPGAKLLLAEPKGHVNEKEFEVTLDAAKAAGFAVVDRPAIRGSRSAVLMK